MSDPTRIPVADGDTEQIINIEDVKAGIPYAVEVYSNPVKYAHTKAAADRGLTLVAGQTHLLSNFRGEGIWVAADEGDAEVKVRPAGAELDTQPPKGVTIENVDLDAEVDVSDRASREIGKARLQNSGGVLVDPATKQNQSAIQSAIQSNQNRTVTNTVDVQHVNYDSVTSFSQSPDQPMQSSAVPAGVEVIVQADADNIDPVYVGEIELSAGSVFTAQVSNTDKLSVSGSAGDQIRVFHEG